MELEKLGSPLVVGGVSIRNRIFLAPMSGVTDAAFRARAHAHGAGLVVSEMVASGELARARAESARRIRRPDVDVHVVQIAGREAHWMAEAARVAVGEGADIVDINMGCPAKKVTGGYSGSALMRDPDHALSLIEAVVAAVDAPVTLKTRLGWDEDALNAPLIARRAEEAGVRMVTIHGRTRCQFYNGRADWRAIARVRQAITVPLVANGDVADEADAQAILEQSGADAVMIGRAHYGAPWLAGSLSARLGGKPAQAVPETGDEIADYVVAHYEGMLSLYGSERGVRHARKHLGWYLDRHAPHAEPETRQRIVRDSDPAVVTALLRACLRESMRCEQPGMAA